MGSDDDDREDEDMPSDEEMNEEDEEEEEEEEEEQDRGRGRQKKKAKRSASYYLDEEAEEDSDEEEEDAPEVGYREQSLDPAEVERAKEERRRRYEENLRNQNRSAEEIAEIMHKRWEGYGAREEFDDDEQRDHITQQSFLPTFKDPKMWMVGCKHGSEKQMVINLMQKFIDKQGTPEALLIKSAVCQDHLPGYIYVEADKESHVSQAIKGLRALHYKLKLVPIREMVDVMTVAKKNLNLKRGDWVRSKRGVYKGDLAQVYQYDEVRGKLIVKFIPRLAEKNDNNKRSIRPAAKFFNPDDYSNAEKKLDYYIYDGNKYKDGYLLKQINLKSVQTNVIPSIDELQRFQEAPDSSRMDDDETPSAASSIGLANLKAPIAKNKVIFAKGDTVRVIEGDLRNLKGEVDSVEGDFTTSNYTVHVMPKEKDLNDMLSFTADQLVKWFKNGDQVKVMSGKYNGETGLVVKAEGLKLTLFSNASSNEIEVLAADVQKCTDVATGTVRLGNYELHDLVTISATQVGVIIQVDKESFGVLDNNNVVQHYSLQEIGSKRYIRDAVASDAYQRTITLGETVKIVDGMYKGQQGVIKYLFKNMAFIYSREYLHNSGIFVVPSRTCASLNSANRRPEGQFLHPAAPPQSPSHYGGGGRNERSPMGPPRGGGRGGGGGSYNRRRAQDSLVNKTVTITKGNRVSRVVLKTTGQWKGYIGIVKDVTEINVRVELHTRCRIVSVPRDAIAEKHSNNAQQNSNNDSAFPPQTPLRRENDMRTMSTPVRGSGPFSADTAWDPSAPSTPMRATTPAYDPTEYGTGYGSGSNTISTPGGGGYYYPFSPAPSTSNSGVDHGQVHTPGTGFDTPGSSFTPSGGPTPSGTYDQRTPGYAPPTTPGNMYIPPTTPGSMSYMTPTTPQTPHTPGESLYSSSVNDSTEHSTASRTEEQDPEWNNWFTEDIVVKIADDYDGDHSGVTAVIRQVISPGPSGHSKVEIESNKEEVTIGNGMITPVIPGKKARLKVIRGPDHKGCTGTLMGTDGGDGIVRIDPHLDIAICNLHRLAVYSPAPK
ncbi:transcription elongation factor SPT5-like [Planoprotostelium fungivorum]|uniref:Transcription elongation factor SPT5 n=1 Tax=Planoprotostelium fungivorum TaxID=1890364 RepID=A0A2P6NDI1_9EUKA|nr:transcription elongation factor SPT5-like [Planoprotostelium fungivorum]